ncbi:MAG: HIT domain-containing protein [Candidatus Omnitrophota bacterium]|jgi:ATP adenylyltransferase
MDKLWAPWRINYIKKVKKQKGCLFCRSAKSKKDKHRVFKTKFSVCILNIFPYNNGHLMVSPKRHINDLAQLKKEELLDLMAALNKAKALLDRALKPQGYNIGLNMGGISGAGISGHLHIHIVPRWKGDTNFMPVLYQTKVISQSLGELLKLLKHAGTSAD